MELEDVGGAGVKVMSVFSSLSRASREGVESQGGGIMLARRWRLRRRASHRGIEAREGGWRVGIKPWGRRLSALAIEGARNEGCAAGKLKGQLHSVSCEGPYGGKITSDSL